MKEDLYLLFRKYLESKFLYFQEYLLYLLSKLNIKIKPPLKSLLLRGKVIPLVIEYTQKIDKYLIFKHRIIFIDNQNWKAELNSLDKTKEYLLIGNKKYLEYLKKENFKIICDG